MAMKLVFFKIYLLIVCMSLWECVRVSTAVQGSHKRKLELQAIVKPLTLLLEPN